jgi:hypothetical protein
MSYDMRIFIASILLCTGEPLKSFFIKDFKKYGEGGIVNEKGEVVIDKFGRLACNLNKNYFHEFYKSRWNHAIDYDPSKHFDELFKPSVFMENLFRFRALLKK